jgi:hypothetical protein
VRGFGTRPRGHGDGVATLQYRALVGEAGQVAPQGYGYEVRGVASWRGGSVGCQRSDPVPGILAITEFEGVRPVYGVSRAVRDARCADATPHIHFLSHFGRVCAIRGAFRRNPRVAWPRKDGTRDALRQHGSLGL